MATAAHAQDVDAGTSDLGTTESAAPKDALARLPAAAPIAYKAVLEKAEVGLAEPFAYTVEIRHAPEESYEPPAIIEWGPFHARDQKTEPAGESPKVTVIRFQLQAFDVGELEVPAIRLLAKTAEGPKQLELPAQKIKVAGVIDASQGDPKMREDRRPLPRAFRTVWWPLALIAGLALLAYGIVWWRRRADRPAPLPPPKPRLPPYAEALERLRALEGEQLVAKGEKQAYFFRLAEIARDYLGRRYGFDALELTTRELLSELRKRSTPGLEYDQLTDFLDSADLVKFARIEPSDGQCKGALDMVHRFLDRTRPVPQTTAEVRS